MSEPKPSATCRCGYALLPGRRCPECGREYSEALPIGTEPPQTRIRIIQFLCSLGCILAIGLICWPGPHGGFDFFGTEFVPDLISGNISRVALFLLAAPCVLLVCSSSLRWRMIRIITTTIATLWLLSLLVFALALLAHYYVPAIPAVLASASPFLLFLAICDFLATRPRHSVSSPPGWISRLGKQVAATVVPLPGASARLNWFRLAFWLLVMILMCSFVWWGFTGDYLLLAPPLLVIGLLACPVLVIFMIGIWLVGKRSN